MNGKIIPLISTKGSVGKTSLVVHISGYLASLGYKVLLIDADSQQSISRFFDYPEIGPDNVGAGQMGFGRWLTGDAVFDEIVRKTGKSQNLDVVFNDDPNKLGIPRFLRDSPGAVFKLGYLLRPLRERYDYIFIDTEGTDGRDHNGNSVQHAALFAEPDLVLSVTKTKYLFAAETLRAIDVYRQALKSYANIGKPDFHAPLRIIINEHDNNLSASQGELDNLHSIIDEERKKPGTDVALLDTIVPLKRKFFEASFKEKIFAHEYEDPNVHNHINEVIRDLCDEIFPEIKTKRASVTAEA